MNRHINKFLTIILVFMFVSFIFCESDTTKDDSTGDVAGAEVTCPDGCCVCPTDTTAPTFDAMKYWNSGNTIWTENFTHNGNQETILNEVASIAASSGATDVVGNAENAGVSPSFVLDTEKPTLSEITASPPTQTINGFVNITCNATDLVGIDTVKVVPWSSLESNQTSPPWS